VNIIFSDVQAYLDNMKAPWELFDLRTSYYQEAIKAMLVSIEAPLDKLKFVKGHVINQAVSGLDGHVSKSELLIKIDLLDSAERIKEKLSKVLCELGNVKDNDLLSLVENLLFPILSKKESFKMGMSKENGGNVQFSNFKMLKDSYAKEEILPGDLKESVENYIESFLAPIRKKLQESKELQELVKWAYPEPPKIGK